MSTPAKVQEWLRNNNGNLTDAYKAVKYEGPPLKIKEGNLSTNRSKIRLAVRGENGDLARRKFDTTSTPTAHYESKQLHKQSSALSREAKMLGLEGTRIEHLADQDDAKHMTSGAPGDPNNKAIVKASDAEFKNEVKRRLGKDYAVTLNPAEESVKAVPKKYYSPIADPNLLPGTNLRNLQDLAEFVARGSGRSLMSAWPVVGIAAGGLEAKARTEKAMQTGNPLDKMQAGLAVGGQFPGAGNALDMLNFVVDMVRNPTAYTPQARYLQQSRNILPYGR
tara:strand:- start:358 stop:1194 length:837 start_codon:yes stop_codon:yes gene_type:complete